MIKKRSNNCSNNSRNIIVLGDHIKSDQQALAPPVLPQSLVAATKKMKISDIASSGNNNWEEDCAINFSEIPVDSLKCCLV